MHKLSILHVEDDEDTRTIAQTALSLHLEFELTQFASGADAVSCAPDLNADLLLLDFAMPEMNGLATLEKLRELPQYKSTPAIFVTAKAEKNMKEMLLDAGAVSVIVKPFDPMTLGKTVLRIYCACCATSNNFGPNSCEVIFPC